MMDYILAYLFTAIAFLVIDAIWLGKVAPKFYYSRLGNILLEKPNLGVATIFYVVYIVGIVVFAVSPALDQSNAMVALINGALFGFCAYATYDITNYATLKNWSLTVTLVDLTWGTILTGSTAYLGYQLTQWLL